MSTEPFFNPSPALQGQLLEAIASDQSSINQLAQTFNTTAEALSLFITTDSFATRFAAIGSTNASLIRFSAGLNLHSAVKLLNTLALKLDEQLRTIPVDYTNPVSIEQFRRRAECARQVASALYRLSRFTHEPRPARAANSNSDSYQDRPSAPAAHQTPNHERTDSRAQWRDQPQDQPLNYLHNEPPEAAINQPLPTPARTSIETRGSGTPERTDPATQSPLPVPNLNQARASESTERSDPRTPSAALLTRVAPAQSGGPTAAPSEPSPSATSRAASVTSVFLPSSPASSASLPASTPAAPRSESSPSASETSAFPPSAFPSSEPLDDEALEILANQLLAFTNMLESKLPQPAS